MQDDQKARLAFSIDKALAERRKRLREKIERKVRLGAKAAAMSEEQVQQKIEGEFRSCWEDVEHRARRKLEADVADMMQKKSPRSLGRQKRDYSGRRIVVLGGEG